MEIAGKNFHELEIMPYNFYNHVSSWVRSIYESFIHTSLYLSLIAVAETISIIVLADLPLSLAPVVIGLLTFSVYANDQLIDLENDDIVNPRRREYIDRHQELLYVFASVSYGIALSLSVWGGPLSFLIALIPGIAWILYASDVISRITSLVGIGLSQVKDIFLVNTLLVGIAWAVTLLFIPLGYARLSITPVVIVLFIYLFLRTFKNTEVANIPDRIQDADKGVSTLPTVLDTDRTRWILHAIDGITAVVLLYAVWKGYLPQILSLALFAGLAYSTGLLTQVKKYRNNESLTRFAECEYLVVFGVLAVLLFQRNPQINVSMRQLMPLTTAAALMIAIGIGTSAGLLAWREYPEPGSLPLVLMLAGQSWWSATLFLEFQATSLETKILLADIRWIGIVLIPVGWLLFALDYTGRNRFLRPRYIAGLMIIPALTMFLALTGQFNSLLYQSSEMAFNNGLSYLDRTRGPWFWVIAAYTYLLGSLGAIPLLELIRDNSLLFRGQSTALLIGIAVPWVTNALFLAGMLPFTGFDPTPLAFAVSGVAYLGALTRFQLLGSSPTPSRSARSVAYERMGQGVVVIDRNDFVVDINPKMAEMFETTVDEAMGKPIRDLISYYEQFPDQDTESIIINDEERNRSYEGTVSTISDPYGRTTSKIITLTDITDIVERDQRISVLNRILRHNIRNELSVVNGQLDMLLDEAPEKHHERIKEALQSTGQVVELAERARHIERTLHDGDTAVQVSVTQITESAVMDAREQYPTAEIAYEARKDPEQEVTVEVVDGELLQISLMELIENAIVHNDVETPQVTVCVQPDEDQTQIIVADNGPGIPDQEKDVLTARTETSLKHSSGLGLWIANWTISLSGGDLSFAENDPRGSLITISLPSTEGCQC